MEKQRIEASESSRNAVAAVPGGGRQSAKPEPTDAQGIIASAKRLISEKKFPEAESLLKDLLDENPRNKYAVCLLLSVYRETDRIKSAEKLFLCSARAQVADEAIYATMIKTYGMVRMFQSAEEIYEEAKDKCLIGRALFSSMASVFCKAKKTKEALDTLDEAEHMEMLNPNIFTSLINYFAREGDIEKAEKLYRQAIESGNADTFLHAVMMRIYEGHLRPPLSSDVSG